MRRFLILPHNFDARFLVLPHYFDARRFLILQPKFDAPLCDFTM